MNLSIRQRITRNLLNIPGWRTRRKIVVIESDDWGSIRMPSKEAYNTFLAEGIRVDQNPYSRYDSLATPQDLEALFETLQSVKDKNGNPAVLTANTIVANPNFEKIKESEFSQYFYEPFTETLKRSATTENSFTLWKQGIAAGLFRPQFHGREHLNVKKWMHDLKKRNPLTLAAFDLGTFGLGGSCEDPAKGSYIGAFDSGLPEDISYYNKMIKEGLELFFQHFQYHSRSFIATTYTWNPAIEPALYDNGVRYLQGMVVQRIPVDFDNIFEHKRTNFTGFKSKSKLTYITRNAYFEPSHSENFEWIKDCMQRIKIAFFWGKPAVISMHRLNVIGAIQEENRTKNLKTLKKLLNEIVRTYPEVEFMSTDRLGKLITNESASL